MIKSIVIQDKEIGEGHKPFVVAELSANHNGSIERAFETIKSAKESGADAIKLQTYTPDTLTIPSKKEDFLITEGLWEGLSLHELYQTAHTPFEWHKELFDYSKDLGLICFSSPFDESAVDLLEELNTPAYKIASFELVDIPLIKYAASTLKPIIMSTGMANFKEIEEAVEAVLSVGNTQIILLHCISGYPTPANQSNLLTIQDLRQKFKLNIGLSDHTMGTHVSVSSIALGSCFIEKHFTLSRSDVGPDSSFSLEPKELKKLCFETKEAWEALGEAGYERKSVEKANIKFRRSIYVVKDIKEGEIFSQDNLRRIRPGYGLEPKYYNEILGKRAKVDIKMGTAMEWSLLENLQ